MFSFLILTASACFSVAGVFNGGALLFTPHDEDKKLRRTLFLFAGVFSAAYLVINF